MINDLDIFIIIVLIGMIIYGVIVFFENDGGVPDKPDKVKPSESEIDKWISVKDRLPENGKRVLAFSYLEDLDVIIIYRWDKYWELREITHWQPLPNPPESEGK